MRVKQFLLAVLILHKFSGKGFHVMRHETNFFDKETHRKTQFEKVADAV